MSAWCCGLHADFTNTHILFCWVAMQASSLLLSHAAHRRHVQAHYHAGRCLSAAALCMEPGQWSVRERPRSEPHCRTHVSAVTPPLCGPQTYTHTESHNVHRSVAWQICTWTRSPTACQTKVNVIRSVSWFHCLWIGSAYVIQQGLA